MNIPYIRMATQGNVLEGGRRNEILYLSMPKAGHSTSLKVQVLVCCCWKNEDGIFLSYINPCMGIMCKKKLWLRDVM